MTAHRETQYQENKAFDVQEHQKNTSFLESKLAANTKMTQAQKTELINHFESQYQENVNFRDQRHNANIAYFQKIANDPSLIPEQKKAAIKTYMDQQKAQDKAHHQEQRSENQVEKAKIRSEIQSQK